MRADSLNLFVSFIAWDDFEMSASMIGVLEPSSEVCMAWMSGVLC